MNFDLAASGSTAGEDPEDRKSHRRLHVARAGPTGDLSPAPCTQVIHRQGRVT